MHATLESKAQNITHVTEKEITSPFEHKISLYLPVNYQLLYRDRKLANEHSDNSHLLSLRASLFLVYCKPLGIAHSDIFVDS